MLFFIETEVLIKECQLKTEVHVDIMLWDVCSCLNFYLTS